MIQYRRSLVAFLLTLVAVALPSAAWFYAGQRQLDRELHLREKAVYSKGQKKGLTLAERLATRLAVLLEAESRRPFYHYQNLFHDPQGAAEGAAVSVSPLARGIADPLVKAHFQIDEDGRLTLPTINDEFPELGMPSTDVAHCSLLEELRDVAFFCFGELEDLGLVPTSERLAGDEIVRITRLSRTAWRQHLRANAVYGDLKYGKSSSRQASLVAAETSRELMAIEIGSFRWHTLPVGPEPGLVALRHVKTPAGIWTQGFVVSPEGVDQQLATVEGPVIFAPREELGQEGRERRMIFPVSGTDWGVGLDVAAGLSEVSSAVAADRERFFAFFLLGVLLAAGAGLLVVTMVFQSERLALQRAQFAASAAHELRTPLAGLRLYGEMLAEGLGNPERARQYARRMAGEAERLGRVVTNVLSFTRLERKSLSVHPEPGDLAAEVQRCLARQQPGLEEAGARFDIVLAEDLPPVRFDGDAVSHILQNLLDNAEKYTRGVPDRTIEVRLEPAASSGDGASARLRVLDNGPGIPRAVQRRLFRAYARGEHDDAEGLGLGLVLVRALVRAQGGRIRYRDRPSGGAEFIVTFVE